MTPIPRVGLRVGGGASAYTPPTSIRPRATAPAAAAPPPGAVRPGDLGLPVETRLDPDQGATGSPAVGP
jgi:hypothetical protein